jgi:hypothetical protein
MKPIGVGGKIDTRGRVKADWGKGSAGLRRCRWHTHMKKASTHSAALQKYNKSKKAQPKKKWKKEMEKKKNRRRKRMGDLRERRGERKRRKGLAVF